MVAITEKELPTKYIRNKRDRDSGKTPTCNNKCRLCHTAIEDVSHLICNCRETSARYYLRLRHDRIGYFSYTNANRQIQLPSRFEHYKESCREEKQLHTTHS